METLLKLLTQWSGPLALILLLATIGLAVVLSSVHRRVQGQRRRWNELLTGVDAENVEVMLVQHMKEKAELEATVQALTNRIANLEMKMKSAKRFVGLHRYNAFEEVGGEQSFALAVYDEEGDGVVLTSQVGRTTARMFGKKLERGRFLPGLAAEEEEAIEDAVGGRTKPQMLS